MSRFQIFSVLTSLNIGPTTRRSARLNIDCAKDAVCEATVNDLVRAERSHLIYLLSFVSLVNARRWPKVNSFPGFFPL